MSSVQLLSWREECARAPRRETLLELLGAWSSIGPKEVARRCDELLEKGMGIIPTPGLEEAEELAELNDNLEQRVNDQVDEIEKLARLNSRSNEPRRKQLAPNASSKRTVVHSAHVRAP